MYLCFCCFYFDDAAFDRCRGVLHTPQFISGQVFRVPGQTSLPPVGGRQGRRPSFPSTRPTSLAAAAALTFFCSFSCVKTRKGEEQGLCPFSRVKTGEEQGLCPFTPTFFSSLDGRKEGKRRSRRQGRRPSFPGTWPNFPAPSGDVRDAGQVFRVRYASTEQ